MAICRLTFGRSWCFPRGIGSVAELVFTAVGRGVRGRPPYDGAIHMLFEFRIPRPQEGLTSPNHRLKGAGYSVPTEGTRQEKGPAMCASTVSHNAFDVTSRFYSKWKPLTGKWISASAVEVATARPQARSQLIKPQFSFASFLGGAHEPIRSVTFSGRTSHPNSVIVGALWIQRSC